MRSATFLWENASDKEKRMGRRVFAVSKGEGLWRMAADSAANRSLWQPGTDPRTHLPGKRSFPPNYVPKPELRHEEGAAVGTTAGRTDCKSALPGADRLRVRQMSMVEGAASRKAATARIATAAVNRETLQSASSIFPVNRFAFPVSRAFIPLAWSFFETVFHSPGARPYSAAT